jgi:hypothetical protein
MNERSNMRKIYITFSGQAYHETTKIIVENAPKYGAEEVWVYDDVWLMTQDFYKLNHWLWEHKNSQIPERGFGWYCWKPYVIWDALSKLNNGDIVLFTDADTYPIRDFSMLFDQCVKDGGIMLFAASSWPKQAVWCKADCFIVMGQHDEKSLYAPAGTARFMLFQKGRWKATQFLMEWITYSTNRLATTFDASILGDEDPEHKEHRCEQAIMTNLATKYGLKLYREADQTGNWSPQDKELYQQLFEQNNEILGIINDNNTREVSNGSVFQNVPA